MGGRRLALIGLVVAIVAGAVIVTTVVARANEEDIFLEGANSIGKNPFTTVAAITPTTTAATTTTVGGPTTTALYGGTGSQKYCDPEALITFLMSHPDKAAAWVGALNSDPTLEWSGGKALTVNDIPAYIHELTPGFLAADTRVTNHGFANGKATPHQSVLQAGTAVLFDKMGVPRARCACGNPLLPPKKVRHPHYHGPCWFDTTTTTRRPTTTTSTSTSTSSTSTSTTIPSTVTSTSTTLNPGPALGGRMQLILARHSGRCGDDPYCSPPGCVATTTSVPETTTTAEATTTTSCTQVPGAVGCGTPTTQRPSVGATTTKPPPTVTVPATTTTRRPIVTTTTQRGTGATSTTAVPGKP